MCFICLICLDAVLRATLVEWMGWQCQTVRHFGPDGNISATIGWMKMTFCTDINGPQTMNPTGSGDPLSFPLASPLGLHLWL